MNGNYNLTYQVWPYSAPEGQKEMYEKGCGERVRTHKFYSCSDFDDAYQRSKVLLEGVRTNPFVWMTPIVKLEHER